ncbi:unnamed protein product [Fraxinus pennsylvanica]|uniref:Uncharacterized protein n=1 Tax=Fraxinus pennsylvanica TaxID=56036 RepID=A0AAD2DN72_9LAMI|nr:unnamed protein product [Fraxinus pennsylvanica]
MESTPRTKNINIKCDSSKSDWTWKWLELWKSILSVSNEEILESGLAAKQQKENSGCSVAQVEIAVPSEKNLDLQANKSTPPSSSHICEQSQSQNIDESNSRYNTPESLPIQAKESDLISEVEHKSVPGKAETENEDMLAAKRFPSEQPETDVKSYHSVQGREMDLAENSVSHASVVQIAGSQCWTELSISSTLDSPDRSEVGAIEFEQGQKVSEGTEHTKINEIVEIETNGKSSIPATDLSYTKSDQLERLDNAKHANGESDNSMNAADSSQAKEKPDTDPIDVQLELESEACQPAAYKSSPEASP